MRLSSLLVAVACAALPWQARAQIRTEAEDLEVVRTTAGGQYKQEMSGYADPGTFSGDHIVHWTGQENPGDLIEFKVPVAKPGKYRITLGIVKSWDYGIYQPMVDGKDVGRALDLYSAGPEERSFPAKVDIGTVEVSREHILLAMRFTGTNPESKSDPNPGGMGLDWVMLTPVTGASGGTATTGTTGTAGSATGPGVRIEAEDLEVARVTTGDQSKQEMGGFADPGTFSKDHVVHWYGQENPGDLIEFKVPVAKPGKYRITLGIVKSWDYGIFQPMVDGKDVGRALDLYSAGPEERSFPAKVDIGTVDVQREHILLAMRFTGTNPDSKSDPNPGSMGLDWVMLTPVTGASGGTAGPVTQTPAAGPVGYWYDPSSGVLLVVAGDGTFVMVHPDRAATPRSGNWASLGGSVSLRTHLASPTQLWDRQISSAAAAKLVAGPYDLSMVWSLKVQNGNLTGALRAGTPKMGPDGGIASFLPYNHPGVNAIKVTFRPVPNPAPAILRPTIEKIRTAEPGRMGSALKDWANAF